jgi:hypothetical protein
VVVVLLPGVVVVVVLELVEIVVVVVLLTLVSLKSKLSLKFKVPFITRPVRAYSTSQPCDSQSPLSPASKSNTTWFRSRSINVKFTGLSAGAGNVDSVFSSHASAKWSVQPSQIRTL